MRTTQGRRLLLRLALSAIVACAVLVPVMPAHAASNGQWSVQPYFDGSENVPRDWFEYTLEPGQTLSDQVAISNLSDRDKKFAVYPTDGYNTSVDGGFAFLLQEDEPEDLGTWLTTAASEVTIPPGQQRGRPLQARGPDERAARRPRRRHRRRRHRTRGGGGGRHRRRSATARRIAHLRACRRADPARPRGDEYRGHKAQRPPAARRRPLGRSDLRGHERRERTRRADDAADRHRPLRPDIEELRVARLSGIAPGELGHGHRGVGRPRLARPRRASRCMSSRPTQRSTSAAARPCGWGRGC